MGKTKMQRMMILAALFFAPLVGVVSFYFLFGIDEVQEEIKKGEPIMRYTELNEQIKLEAGPDFVQPSQPEMQSAMDVATEFALRFHVMDLKDPFKYVKEAKPYMTDEMYEAYKEIPKRGTLTDIENKIIGVEIWPHTLKPDQFVFQVDIHSNSFGADDVITKSYTGYLVSLTEETNGKWKVNGVNVIGD